MVSKVSNSEPIEPLFQALPRTTEAVVHEASLQQFTPTTRPAILLYAEQNEDNPSATTASGVPPYFLRDLRIVPTPGLRQATLKPPPPPAPVPRSCIICTDTFSAKPDDPNLVKPCAVCPSDYCLDCLEHMFETAVEEGGARMPPRCCSLIQLYTVLPRLNDDTADVYRAKFTEWLTRDKVYCPAPACSAFIPEIHVPARQDYSGITTLKDILAKVLDKVELSTASRFFRTREMQLSLPNYCWYVDEPIDLAVIRERVDEST
jgi:hypothetical protein